MTRPVLDRDFLGQLVRMAWVEWAMEQENAKPSWLLPWSTLPEHYKEADRRIGEYIARRCVMPELLSVTRPVPSEVATAILEKWASEKANESRPDGDQHLWNSRRVYYLATRCAAAEAEVAENVGVMNVLRHRAEQAEARLERLREVAKQAIDEIDQWDRSVEAIIGRRPSPERAWPDNLRAALAEIEREEGT